MTNRQMDRAVAEKIFELTVVETWWGKQNQYGHLSLGAPEYYDDRGESILENPLPCYSTNISDTMQLIDFLREEAWIVTIIGSQLGGYDCTLECGTGARGKFYSDPMEGENYTMPEAVCMAALRAYKAFK